MKSISIKPTNLISICNDIYLFPDGIPTDTTWLSGDGRKTEYLDQNGIPYFICYGSKQILKQVTEFGFFSPYIPLMLSSK